MKTLLALLLLIPSLSWGDHNKTHADFQNQIEEELRSEGKISHQSKLTSIDKEKEYCANEIKRFNDNLISQDIDPDELSLGKHSCEEQLEITMMIYEKSERLRIERIIRDLLHIEIIKLNEQKLKSNNNLEIEKLDSQITDMGKKYDMYVYGREFKKNECFYTGTCGYVSISNNPLLNKPNLNKGGIDFSSIQFKDTNKTYQFPEADHPTPKYVPSSTFNNLPKLGDGFSTKKPFTEPFKEGTGLNYNEQFWFD